MFFGCRNASLAFLLKAVKHKNGLSKLDGVDGSVSATHSVLHDFKYPSTLKALEHFRRIVLIAHLGKDKANPKNRRTSTGKAIKSLWLLPIHCSGFSFSDMSEIYMNQYIRSID